MTFREHEWLKHGTCTDMNEKTFFSKVLSLFENGLNYGLILNKSGIVPSMKRTYDVRLFSVVVWLSFGCMHPL